MKIKDFQPNERAYLKMTDLENFFNVYLDKRGNYVYNLNTSLYFDIEDNALEEYVLNHDMHWTLISYKLYQTPRLAWLLMKLNNISAADVFKKRLATEKVKYIPKKQLETLVSMLGDD